MVGGRFAIKLKPGVTPQVRGNVVTTKLAVKGFTSKLGVSAHFMEFSFRNQHDLGEEPIC